MRAMKGRSGVAPAVMLLPQGSNWSIAWLKSRLGNLLGALEVNDQREPLARKIIVQTKWKEQSRQYGRGAHVAKGRLGGVSYLARIRVGFSLTHHTIRLGRWS